MYFFVLPSSVSLQSPSGCVKCVPSISRCMGWREPAPRLEGDLRLIWSLFLARSHWHNTVWPTGHLRKPTNPQWTRPWTRPTERYTGVSEATKRGESTFSPNTPQGEPHSVFIHEAPSLFSVLYIEFVVLNNYKLETFLIEQKSITSQGKHEPQS